MIRNLFASVLVITLVSAATVHSQDPETLRPLEVKIEQAATGSALYHPTAVMRELWVGLPGGGVDAPTLLRTMRKAFDDTTAVAVLDVNLAADTVATEAELATLRLVSQRTALATLKKKLSFNDAHTRLVLLGVFESGNDVLRLAGSGEGIAPGVAMIDPPVSSMDRSAAWGRMGVDVLLHPRSNQEFEHEQAMLTSMFGGGTRVIRSGGHFDTLDARLHELRTHIRGYAVLQEGKPSTETGEAVSARFRAHNVVMVGELHGNPGAHRLQLEVLRAMKNDRRELALSMEQFERDVQPVLDRYLKGEITEEEFLKNSRPWPNYADYRPLIEFCKANKIPVIAGNIPRRLASRVFKEGVGVLSSFTEDEQRWSAHELNTPSGAYRDKFMKVMGGADGHNDNLERMYAAQCFKDDTMADSIASWLKANPKGRVLHVNGGFHSAGGLGVPEKLKAMSPDVKIGLITCLEAGEELPQAAPDEVLVRVPASRRER